jgi:hypothetical protein
MYRFMMDRHTIKDIPSLHEGSLRGLNNMIRHRI